MTAFLIEILVELMLIVGAGAFVFVPMWVFSRIAPEADSSSRCGGGGGAMAAR